MFHVELRQFPHNACAFNLDADELYEKLAGPWSRDEWVEFGERKWSPHRSQLTVLEGPHLELADLSMGRGWRNAERLGKDVTEAVLADARARPEVGDAPAAPPPQPAGPPAPAPAPAGPPAPAGLARPLAPAGLAGPPAPAGLAGLLGEAPDALLAAWRLAAERRPDLAPSEALALAERTLGALDDAGSG
jgi:hypothetical protein